MRKGKKKITERIINSVTLQDCIVTFFTILVLMFVGFVLLVILNGISDIVHGTFFEIVDEIRIAAILCGVSSIFLNVVCDILIVFAHLCLKKTESLFDL